MRQPDIEDQHALLEYSKRFFTLHSLEMNDAEREQHNFDAGFFCGIDWALEHKSKVVTPTEPIEVLGMDIPTIRGIRAFAVIHGWDPTWRKL